MAELVQGLLLGTVTAVDAKLGAIKAKLHDRGINTHWAPVAVAMSGNGRGAYFMPELEDEVVLGFDRGRFDHPYVVGFLWNGPDKPPRTDPRMRVLRSVNGHEIVLYDAPIAGG